MSTQNDGSSLHPILRLGKVARRIYNVFALVLTVSLLIPWAALAAPVVPAATQTNAPAPAQAPETTVPILVKFKSAASAADIDATVKAGGGQVVREIAQNKTRVINVPAATASQIVAAYSKQPSVEKASAAIKMKKAGDPNDPGYAQQWALQKIGWNQVYGSVAINGTAKIAVLDTGIDATQPDLAPVMAPGTSFINGNANIDPSDPNGHGTALAGIAAAAVNNGAGMAGVAYTHTSVAPVQVLQADGTGYDSDIVSGVYWAADNGANVILMGFSSTGYSSFLADALAYAWSKGVVLVAATGNDGSSAVTYPAGMPNVIGVAATDQNDTLAASSNTGSATVAAPGVGIYATLTGGNYGSVSGTSASSAEVAGLAALLVAGGKSNADAANLIRNAVDPVTGQSFGRISVAKAFGVSAAPQPTATPVATATAAPQATPTAQPTPTAGATPIYVIATKADITGRVTIFGTNTGLSGALVTCSVTTDGCSSVVTATTDVNGFYTLTVNFGNATGNLHLTASATGYQSVVNDVSTDKNGKTVNFALTSSQQSTSLTVAAASGTYGGSAVLMATLSAGSSKVAVKSVSFTLNGASVGTATTDANGVASITASLAGINAGTYTSGANSGVAASFAGDSQYTASSGSNTLTVSKANQTITFGALANKVYTDTDFTVSASASSGLAVNFTVGATDNCTISGNTVHITGAGSCTVTAHQAGDTNYNAAPDVAQTFSIAKATATLTLSNLSQAYDGQPKQATVTTNPAGLTGVSVSYSQNNTSVTNPTSAGSYDVVASLNNPNYQAANATGTLVIGKASVTITWNNPADITYGTALGTTQLNATASVPGSFAYTPAAGTVLNAGDGKTLHVVFTPTDSANYAATSKDVVINVKKATLTVTTNAASRVYGDANPAFSVIYSGFVNNDDASKLGGSLTFVTTADAGSPVGSYDVTPSGVTSGNYAISFVKGTLTVTARPITVTADAKSKSYGDTDPALTYQITAGSLVGQDAFTGALTRKAGENVGAYDITQGNLALSSNYVLTFVGAKLTIGQRAITVTADPQSKTYGDADPTLTYTVTSGSLVGSDAFTGSLSRAVGESVGQYDITQGTLALSGNYALTYVGAKLTIGSKALTVTAKDQSRTYGAGNPTLGAGDVTISGFATGETAAVLGGTLGFAFIDSNDNAVTAASPVGIYKVRPSGLTSGNYTITFVDGAFTINKAVLTVTANDASRAYGAANPSFTAGYSGFVNSETLATSGVTGAPALDTTAVAGSAVGDYPITAALGTLDAGNYSFNFVNGTLHVGQATLTVTANDTTRVYGDANPVFSVNYSGFVNGDTATSLGGKLAFATTADAGSPVGSYDVTPSGVTSGNYAISFVKGTLAVTPATLTVTPADKTKVYGEANPALDGNIVGIKNGDTITANYSTAATAASGVGSYDITASLNDPDHKLGNYTVTLNKGTLTVTKAALSVKADNASRLYGQANPAFTGTLSGVKNNDNITAGYGTTATLSSPVGTYAIIPTLADPAGKLANYDLTSTNGTLTVGKAAITVKADDKSKVYGDANPGFTGTLTGVQNGDSITAGYSTSADLTSPVGSYAIVPALADPDNKLGNYDVIITNGTLTVTKAALTITADDQSKTYGDANPALTGKIVGIKNNDAISANYGTSADATSGVGTYTIVPAAADATPSKLGNYDVTIKNGTLTINPKALTVTAGAATKVYGEANPSFTVNYSGFVNGDDASKLGGNLTFTTNADRSSGVGSYNVLPGGLTASNYTLSFVSAQLTITARPITVTAAPQSKTYGDADPALSYKVTSGSIVNDDHFSGALSRDAGENVGTYAITQGTLALSRSYALTYVGANLEIVRRAVTVTADTKSKTYGDADPALTYQITTGSLAGQEAFTGALTRQAGEDSGVYDITQGSLALSGNYALTFVGAKLTIGQRAITVTADPQSKTYGDVDPTLTYKVTSGTPVGTDTFSGSLTRAEGENVGTYAIGQGTLALSANYSLSVVGADLTIMPRPVTVTADAKSKIYGDADPDLTYRITEGTLVMSDAFSGSLTRDAGKNVGTYAITQGTLTLSSNYALTYKGANLQINKATLKVTADNKSKVYGDANPAFTASYSGFKYNETLSTSGVAGAPDLTTTADASSVVGDYVITAAGGTLAAANYSFSFVPGKLTITKAPLSVTPANASKVYGDDNPALTGTIDGIKNGDTITANYSTAATAASGVGSYDITASLNDPNEKRGNYDVTLNNGTLTITKAALTITADDQSKTYGDANPALTGKIVGIKNDDAISASYSTIATNNSDAGSYDIMPAAVDSAPSTLGNYDVTLNKGKLTVTQAPLTVTTNGASKTYGDANPTFSVSYSGFVLNQNAGDLGGTLVFDTGATQSSPVGSYDVTPKGLTSSNYAISFVKGTLTVNPKALTVTAGAATKVYGEANPSFTVNYSGFVNGDDASKLGGNLTFTTNADRSSGVGSYNVLPGGLTASNYTLSFVSAQLTITARPLTVSADAQSKTYGAADPALSYKVTSGTLVNGDAFSGALSRDAGENVGLYPIKQGTLGLSSNYALTYVGAKLTINQAPLTVTPADKTKVYGEANPTLDGSIDGIKNGDTITANYSTAATAATGVGSYDITASLNDPNTRLGNYSVTLNKGTLTVKPATLTVTAAGATATEGDASVTLNATVSSPTVPNVGEGSVTFTVLKGTTVLGTATTGNVSNGQASVQYNLSGFGAGTYTIKADYSGSNFNPSSDTNAKLTVKNVAPSVTIAGATSNPLAVGTSAATVNISVSFTDPGGAADGKYTMTIDWGDGTTPTSQTPASPTTVNASHTYAQAGVYTIKATVSDVAGGTGTTQFQYIVVYDPNGGFVTGGGWIMSPAGAYTRDQSLSGKATFGFVSKYQKGANVPTGQTEFQFQAGNFNFHSESYQWLVVSGALAQYKGTGSVNGASGYNFILTARDGQVSGGGGVDGFRIKITFTNPDGSDTVVYDNLNSSSNDMTSANTQAIGGGSITIQSK